MTSNVSLIAICRFAKVYLIEIHSFGLSLNIYVKPKLNLVVTDQQNIFVVIITCDGNVNISTNYRLGETDPS